MAALLVFSGALVAKKFGDSIMLLGDGEGTSNAIIRVWNGKTSNQDQIRYNQASGKWFFTENGIEKQMSDGGGGVYDNTIGATGTFTSFADLNVSGTPGDSAYVNTETVSGSVTFTNRFGIGGGKFESRIFGTVIIASGSDGLSISDVRFGGGKLFIEEGVRNVRITDCWVDPDLLPQDNSNNDSNLIDCSKE